MVQRIEVGADGGHSDTGSWRSEQRTEMGADESVMICHGYFNRPGAGRGATLIILLFVGFCVLAPFLDRLFGVSFTGALASFNDKRHHQKNRITWPLKGKSARPSQGGA